MSDQIPLLDKRLVRRKVRELVDTVIGDREDARVVKPLLRVMVQTAVQDFCRYYDARHAAHRVWDHDFLMARERAKESERDDLIAQEQVGK